jgi:hypothetical protein
MERCRPRGCHCDLGMQIEDSAVSSADTRASTCGCPLVSDASATDTKWV